MVSVFDVAKYILEQYHERKKNYFLLKPNETVGMSLWKLNHLCYYAQAWHFVWTGERLIKEEFRAWRNGAVCVELQNYLAGKSTIHAADITSAINSLTDDEKDSVDVVLENCSDAAPYELSAQIKFEAPYRNARGDTPADVNSDVIIKLADMGEYYSALIEDDEEGDND